MYLFFVLISLFSCCLLSSWANASNILLIIVLTSESSNDASDFLDHFHATLNENDTRIIIYLNAEVNAIDKTKFQQYGTIRVLSHEPLENRNIGILNPPIEYVSFIIRCIDDLLETTSSHPTMDEKLISITFHESSKIRAAEDRFNTIYSLLNSADVLLLAKTYKLTTVSDWHDLRILGLSSLSKQNKSYQWFQTFKQVYLHHADRDAFTLLPPRFALLEANYRHYDNNIAVTYLSHENIHTYINNNNNNINLEMKELTLQPYLSIQCKEHDHQQTCLKVDDPKDWLKTIKRNFPGIDTKDVSFILSGMGHGHARFRNFNSSEDIPRGMCWDTG